MMEKKRIKMFKKEQENKRLINRQSILFHIHVS